MANRIQIRRDTAANWIRVNPILSDGEPGLETDTNKVKYGDGTTAWASLEYASGGGGLTDVDGVVTFPGNFLIGTLWPNDPMPGGDKESVVWAKDDTEYLGLWWGGDQIYPEQGYGPVAGIMIGPSDNFGGSNTDDFTDTPSPEGTKITLGINGDGGTLEWNFGRDGILVMPPGNETTAGWIQWSHASDDLNNVAGIGFVDYYNAYTGLGLSAPGGGAKNIWFGTPADPTDPFKAETSMVFKDNTLYLPKNGFIKSHNFDLHGAVLSNDLTSITIQTADASSNQHAWVFGSDGSLTFPQSSTLLDVPAVPAGAGFTMSALELQTNTGSDATVGADYITITGWQYTNFDNAEWYAQISVAGTAVGPYRSVPVTWAAGSTNPTGFVLVQFYGGTAFGICPASEGGGGYDAGTWKFPATFGNPTSAVVGGMVLTANSHEWMFGTDGTLKFPDTHVQVTAYPGPSTVAPNTVLAGAAINKIYAFQDPNALTGWTDNGSTLDNVVGNPEPSYLLTGGNKSLYRDLGQGFANKVIEFDYLPNGGNAWFGFGTDSNGGGSMVVSLQSGTSSNNGLSDSLNYLYGGLGAVTYTFTPDTWYHIKIVTGAVGALPTWYVNDVLITDTGYGYTLGSGTWFGIIHDGGGYCNFDNIIIYALAPNSVPSFRALVDADIPDTLTVNTITNGSKSWTFGTDGNLTVPGEIHSASGTGDVVIESNSGASTYTWTFGMTGTLNLPNFGAVPGIGDGAVGDIARNDDVLYFKTSTGWKTVNLT